MTTASLQRGMQRAPKVYRTTVPGGRPLRHDDATTLYGVALSPYATAPHLAELWDVLGNAQVVYKSLARLRRNGHVHAVDFRDQHRNPTTTLKLHHITPLGVRALEYAYNRPRDALYQGKMPTDTPMLSSQWQHHLVKHLDTVVRTYDYVCAIKKITERQPNYYFPRQGSLDAWIWQDSFAEGISLGFLRVGPALEPQRLTARIRDLARGADELTSRHRESGGRRGPGLVLISVPTELDKHLVGGWFAPLGRFAGLRLQGLVATEEEAARGHWYNPRNSGLANVKTLAEFVPLPGTFDPVPPDYEVAAIKMPSRLQSALYPVQSRILDCLFRYPLMRPTEIAPTVGVAYNGRFNENLSVLVELGLLKDILDLVRAQLVTYGISERRNRPMLLTDDGLRYLAARDRAKPGRYKVDEDEKERAKRKRQVGMLDRWGTEGVTESGTRFLGGDISKLCRELEHTLEVNASVARMCRDLDYTPEALPDHANRRYYKTSNWMGEDGEERRVTSSVAPDAALVLRDGKRRRTILLEVERSAAKGGGKPLTRKLTVWAEYAKQGGQKYLGRDHHELVCFIVPSDSARDKLIRRLQLLRRRYGPMVQTVVTTESDFKHASNVMHDKIWTLATDPELPKVFIDLPAVPDVKS